ncbi:hypothetical protein CROQUDRAFT_89582 [Cronartium quercuum f. sp. fusiforme G11]|uniref:Uncharacterized protein n=1 Tax=Cronartium quercuum f. sp. fusiforme G11 TaxID=708437 RepID=A0A9P6NL22_9BASI|nr:hypothetical protein CROQUDRAFT_89582 [Cronartium quercuum f. sp. fusiforme G11]
MAQPVVDSWTARLAPHPPPCDPVTLTGTTSPSSSLACLPPVPSVSLTEFAASERSVPPSNARYQPTLHLNRLQLSQSPLKRQSINSNQSAGLIWKTLS